MPQYIEVTRELNLPIRVYPPYQKIRQCPVAKSQPIDIAVSEAVLKTSDVLFYIKSNGRHGTNVVVRTNQQLPGYIYTTVVHPKTGLPLFFKHELPLFGFQSDAELKMQIKVIDEHGNAVPEELYHITVGKTVELWTNLRSTPELVYFVELKPHPQSNINVRHILLLDSRITQQSFEKPAGECWQLDVGYKQLYVPSGLNLDSPWPLLSYSSTMNRFTCVQYAVKIRNNIYTIQPLLYTKVYCKQRVMSVSSHGFAQIESNDAVVKLLCEYVQFGDVVYKDMRRADYEAAVVPISGGDNSALL